MTDNLARVLVREDFEELQRRQIERSRRKAQERKHSVIAAVACVAITVTLAFALTMGYMRIFELERQISENDNRLSILRSTNEQKEISLESAMTLEELEFQAKTRLGMNKPANNQIIYINIHNEDASQVIN